MFFGWKFTSRCSCTYKTFKPTAAGIHQLTPHNCLKSEKALQTFMVNLATECDVIFPRFIAVNSFFPCAFLLFCHSENNSTILTLLSPLNSLLSGVRLLTKDIATLAEAHTDCRARACSARFVPESERSTERRSSLTAFKGDGSGSTSRRQSAAPKAPLLLLRTRRRQQELMCGGNYQVHPRHRRKGPYLCRWRRQ